MRYFANLSDDMRNTSISQFLFLATLFMLFACADEQALESTQFVGQTRFVDVSSTTNIDFANHVEENDSINVIRYDYLYNGGGVAAGDLNNDGLPDLYFTGNQVNDRVYLNNGDLTFTDVTEEWGVNKYPGWSSGAVMVDIDGDGWLDVYVCRTGPHKNPDMRTNRLFINQQGKGFKEEANAYGLDYTGHSTMAAFFDADRDGDLDCYLMTHPDQFRNRINLAEIKALLDAGLMESDRFYRNDNGKFVDVSKQAGIEDFAFGLGLSIEDFNGDGWPDIYVSNDFDEGDALYINNRDGTFTNRVTEIMKHTSNYGMGCDAADFNNDHYVDLIQVDMAFETHERAKRNMASMDPARFNLRLKLGWHYQYMVNTLQLNNGDGTFSDIAQISGVHKTDWSWAAFFADFDNDGWQDLYITNGYKRDTKDNDLRIKVEQMTASGKMPSVEEVLGMIPATRLRNYMFKNIDGLTFDRVNEEWGLDQKINSNGAVYVDLDGDGDLDIVVNNIDAPATIYRNTTNEQRNANANWVAFRLPAGYEIGTRIVVKTGEKSYMRYLQPTRGYLGSMPYELHVGLGDAEHIDEVRIWWPTGGGKVLQNVAVNEFHEIAYDKSDEPERFPKETPLFEDQTREAGIFHVHTENSFDDFEKEVLLPHKMSEWGPGIASGDFTGNGRDDVWVGGAAGQPGAVYIQMEDGTFRKSRQPALELHAAAEDVDAVAIDVNGDGVLDLYVVSGDASVGDNNPALRDRLYLNTGNGMFRDVSATLPDVHFAGGKACVADVNNDGRPDLFIGGRNTPGKYPFPPKSQLLINTGQGFTDATETWFGSDFKPGMITDAKFHDFNNDGLADLIVVGEWMSPTIFTNKGSQFDQGEPIAPHQSGWWFSVEIADLDGDGIDEIICGNIGLNNKFKPSPEKPLYVYAADFDENGSIDIVLAKYESRDLVPVRGRECSSVQMPFITEEFPTYEAFATSGLEDIYGAEALASAYRPDAQNFASMVFTYDEATSAWQGEKLPVMAQFSSVRTIVVADVNHDGFLDLLLAGNFFGVEVETTRYDASNGVVLLNDGRGGWLQMMPHESGLSLPMDVRRSVWINRAGVRSLISAVNDQIPRVHDVLR